MDTQASMFPRAFKTDEDAELRTRPLRTGGAAVDALGVTVCFCDGRELSEISCLICTRFLIANGFVKMPVMMVRSFAMDA